ncbi:MAG: hypothetical protein KJO54_10140 [Gammaproteobacteria bacterium]|nr:hypothetical protein [Gammaproteobacteria bacterium]NNF62318.1 hypothetical protein [Gammaproteobacteria bacterium]NNM20882.1 hypothetical protein [Gammaproteobacteria bacterium]
MSRMMTAVLLMAVLAACSRAGDPDPPQTRFELAAGPGEVTELCFESAAGDVVIYRFEASRPLGFNLHYHVDEEMFFPVPEHETAAEKGQYIVPADQDYCLMWTNSSTDLTATLVAELYGAGAVTAH